jgi:hypothetical protein
MACSDFSTSSSVVAQDETLMRMAVRPCHTVPPHQQVPSLLDRRGNFIRQCHQRRQRREH